MHSIDISTAIAGPYNPLADNMYAACLLQVGLTCINACGMQIIHTKVVHSKQPCVCVSKGTDQSRSLRCMLYGSVMMHCYVLVLSCSC